MKHLTRCMRKLTQTGLSLLLFLAVLLGSFSSWTTMPSLAAGIEPAVVAQFSGATPWPMFHHDPQHSGRSPFIGPQTHTIIWTYQTGGAVNSSPVVGSDGTLYVGSEDGNLYALNPDGTLRWTFPIGAGIYSSPALASDGTIYVGARDHNLYAIHPDGTLKWRYLTNGEVNSSPTVDENGVVYVGSYDGNLYVIEPSGSLHCSYPTGIVVHPSPAIGPDGTIYVGNSGNRMYAINPDCTLKWQSDPHLNVIGSSAALSPDGSALYYGADDGYLYARRTDDGSLLWQSPYTYGGVQASPAVGSDGTVYIGTQYGYLWALDPVDGTAKWEVYTTLSAGSSPVIGADNTIYFATDYGSIFARNADGSEKWTYAGGYDSAGHFHSSAAIGPTGALYIGSSNGKLYAFNTTLLIATPGQSEIYPGDSLAVSLDIQGAYRTYALQASCTVDPAILQAQGGAFGNFFDPDYRLVGANQVDAASGSWVGAISQRSPALPLFGNGNLATLTYQATAPGTTAITCDPVVSDRDGFTQAVAYVGANVTVLAFATLSGIVNDQGRVSHGNISVTATGPVTQSGTTDSAGDFMLDGLRAGSYNVIADAPRYLPVCTTANVTNGQALVLPNAILPGGDANDDGVINIGDATLIAANFGLNTPPADERADINADSIVNIQDLAMLGGNYELSGCQDW